MSDEVFITGDQRNGPNLLVDKDRQYTEDEMRAAILWQSAYRASSARHDYRQLQYQGLSQDAVDFQRAVKDAQRVPTNVQVAAAEVTPAIQAPVGVLLSAYTLHKTYKHKALSSFWQLWKCFIHNAIIDLPLNIIAHFFLLCFTGAVFYAPMWASVTVRFIFYDGEGKIDLDQFIRWLMVFGLCTTALWCFACIFFVLLQERFGNRAKSQITVVSSQFGKLVTKKDVDRFRGEDLDATKRIFFSYAPRGLAAFLVSIAGLNFLFLRSTFIGLMTIGVIVISAIVLSVYDHMVGKHSAAVKESNAAEREFWAFMQSRDKQIATHELIALMAETSQLGMRQSTYHISMGSLFKGCLAASVVGMVAVGSYQIMQHEIRQYELLFSFFYYLFTMNCIFWLNSSTVGILHDLGSAFRLATFLNSTRHCVREWQAEMAAKAAAKEEGKDTEAVRRFAAKTTRPPFAIILITTLMFGGSIAAFITVAATSQTTIGCKDAEMVCNMCGHATHILSVPQHFDMEDGCKYEQTPEEMAENCKLSVPQDSEGARKMRSRKLSASGIKCEVHVTSKTDRFDELGYNVPQEEKTMPVKYTCGEACPAPDNDCHTEGQCSADHGCVYPIKADMTSCFSAGGIAGTCRAGECLVDTLSGGPKRRLDQKVAEAAWHEQRRVRQLSQLSNTRLNLTPMEASAMEGIRANKKAMAEQYANTKRRLQAAEAAADVQPSASLSSCPLPGNEEDEGLCPASVVKGCMDESALNFRPDATLNTQCCYPPNRYVKVEMTESIFMENYWTIHVQDDTGMQVVGTGLPLLGSAPGSDEVCVPEDTCVKVTTHHNALDTAVSVAQFLTPSALVGDLWLRGALGTPKEPPSRYDEACDGFMIGGGGVEVASRVMVNNRMQTFIDNDGNFECSKKTQFGTCGLEGCTHPEAVNYNRDAAIDDGSCEWLSCQADEMAVVVSVKYDENPYETSWKLTDGTGREVLVDSKDFDHLYAGDSVYHYYCYPQTQCVYLLMKDSAGDGMSAKGHYEARYGKAGALEITASGNEFEWIKAHFVGGLGEDGRGCTAPAQVA